MTYREFAESLKAGRTERVYVFCGREAFLRRDAAARLKKKLLPEGLEDFNCQTLTAPSVSEIVAAAETLPMMGERRLVFVQDFAPLSDEKKGRGQSAESAADEAERLLDYLPRVPETACLVFLAGETIDRRKKLGKAMAALPGFLSFDTPDEAEIVRFLARRAAQLRVTIDQAAAERLVFLSGRDLETLACEMKKLSAYAGGSGRISAADVDALATRTPEARVFDMVDAAVAGRAGEAFRQLSTLLAAGETRLGILALIARQLRQMLYAKDMLAAGRTQKETADALGVKPFVAGKLAQRTARLRTERLREALSACTEAEYGVKSGAVREEAALDGVILRLTAL